jgi:hypothetical protein
MGFSNERTQGQERLFSRLFLGFGYVLTGVWADQLKLLGSQNGFLPACGSEPFSNS